MRQKLCSAMSSKLFSFAVSLFVSICGNILFFSGCNHNALSESTAVIHVNKIIGYGDSITYGYGVSPEDAWLFRLDRSLEEHYGKGAAEIINSGVNGNTSREGLLRIKKDVLAYLPGLVIVEFGNDLTSEKDRHVDLEEYANNLIAMNNQIRSQGGIMILMTFPPIISTWHFGAQDKFYGDTDLYQEKYRQQTRKVAQECGIPLIDIDKNLRELVAKNGGNNYILNDGVHLTPLGNKCVADMVFDFLQKNETLWLKTRKI